MTSNTIADQYHHCRRQIATTKTKVRRRELILRLKVLMTKQIQIETKREKRR